MESLPESFWTFVAIAAVAAVGGLICLLSARRMDEENYIVERATPLPIAQVNPGDDVWVGGVMQCPAPLSTPYAGTVCVHFDYKLEERVLRTRTDSKGNTQVYYTWETREHYNRSVDFAVQDSTGAIWVDSASCRFDAIHTGTYQVGSWRHTEYALPYPGSASVVGNVVEGRQWLRPEDNVPLIATYRSREDYIRSKESSERWTRRAGYALLILGLGGVAWLAGMAAAPGQVLVSIGLVALVELGMAVVWALNTHNQLVSYRNRAQAAWHQVDVDLRARYDLVLNLVEVVKAAAAHEREVFERVAQARSAIAAAGGSFRALEAGHEQLTQGVRSLVAVAESYPELKSNQSFTELQEQLSALETKIAHGRTFYNGHATEYNTAVQSFPQSILAGVFGFSRKELFAARAPERETPTAPSPPGS